MSLDISRFRNAALLAKQRLQVDKSRQSQHEALNELMRPLFGEPGSQLDLAEAPSELLELLERMVDLCINLMHDGRDHHQRIAFLLEEALLLCPPPALMSGAHNPPFLRFPPASG